MRSVLIAVLVASTIACSTREDAKPAADEAAVPGEAAAATGPVGRIRGTVTLRGDVPAMRSEAVSQNTDVCGTSVPVTRLAMGKDNSVRHAFVYLEGIETSVDLKPAASLTVEQKGCVYAPHAMTLQAGSPIEIVNGDAILHNVHAKQMGEDGLQTVFNIAQPVRGQRTKVDTPLKPGIVALSCEAGHPWMTAYILVTNNRFVAVTDDNGQFVIDGVPAGTYPIKMWHEGVSLKRIIASLQQYEYEEPYESTEQVIVPAGGEAVVNFDLTLRPTPPGV